MKLITAIIRPDKLDEVRESLIENGISRITVSRVTGHGAQQDPDIYRGKEVTPNLIPKIRIEIAINDKYKDLTIDTILKSAKHKNGELGDGKIFITELIECIRIRTGEQGGKAI